MRPTSDFTLAEAQSLTLDAIGVGKRFVLNHQASLRYVADMDVWLAWDGKRWKLDPKVGQRQELAKDTLLGMHDEAKLALQTGNQDAFKALTNLVRTMAQKLDMVMKHAASDPRIRCMAADLDRDPYLLNCPNGTVDLRTGEIAPHDPAHLITKITATAYDPGALTADSTWLKYLSEVQPDEQIRAYLQLLVGYSMIGGVTRHIMPFLYGAPRTGKSRFVEAISNHAGDYGCTANAELFIQGGSAVSRYDMARLRGSRFISMAEFDENVKVNTSLLKQVTGGDTVPAREAYGAPFTFRPQGTLWVSTNHMPYVGTDDAAWTRVRIIPFDVSFLGREDVTLEERLANDSAVLAWIVQGAKRYCTEKWDEPQSVIEATAGMQQEQDQVKRFLAARTYNVEGGRVAFDKLYDAYINWCFTNSEKAFSSKRFGDRLSQLGYGKKPSNGTMWRHGLEMRPYITQESEVSI